MTAFSLDALAGRSAATPLRRREGTLLLLGAIFVVLNRIALTAARGEGWSSLWPLAVWGVCAIGSQIALNRFVPQRDPFILPIVLLLAGWGLTLVARLAPVFATRQTMWLLVSTVACVASTTLPPGLRILQRYRYSALLGGLLLLGATLILGVNPSGDPFAPRLWLGVAGIYFQPSEILKLLLIIFLASYLAEKREMIQTSRFHLGRWRLPPVQYLAPMLLMWGLCIVLLVWQRDLGTAALFFLIFISLLYAATGEAKYVIVGLLLLGLAGAIGYRLFGVVRLRVDTWWNPWLDPNNRAFQIVQSLLAVAAGGVFGQGVGQGAPTYIPVVHSDFVFAAIAEEWGLIGAIGVMACLMLLVMRGLHLAIRNSLRPFHALLAAGISISFAIQSLLIMGGVLKMLPLTGVTLPFVSYGGSSLLSSFIMIGVLLRISDAGSRAPIIQGRHQPTSTDFTP